MDGRGGFKIRHLGSESALVARALSADRESVRSADAFAKVVSEGLPGNMMPGHATLSGSQLRELHSYVKALADKH
jgi:hypothetical protein